MPEGQGITDELKAMIGTMISEPGILEVERGAIRRYADAIDDPGLLYRDVEYAKNSRYGELICPPGFFGWPIKEGGAMKSLETFGGPLARAGFPRILDGGIEYEFFVPIRAGDTLTSYGKVADITERAGKTGNMLIVTQETTYINQNGDIVAKASSMLIGR
jgi:acyl dehydratase